MANALTGPIRRITTPTSSWAAWCLTPRTTRSTFPAWIPSTHRSAWAATPLPTASATCRDPSGGGAYFAPMANFLQITPFMHVADVEATTRFFADILGFRTLYRQPGYAYIEREGCA